MANRNRTRNVNVAQNEEIHSLTSDVPQNRRKTVFRQHTTCKRPLSFTVFALICARIDYCNKATEIYPTEQGSQQQDIYEPICIYTRQWKTSNRILLKFTERLQLAHHNWD